MGHDSLQWQQRLSKGAPQPTTSKKGNLTTGKVESGSPQHGPVA